MTPWGWSPLQDLLRLKETVHGQASALELTDLYFPASFSEFGFGYGGKIA